MSFTTSALAALTLTIIALGAPSTKMAYAETDPGFMRVGDGGTKMGGSRVIAPGKYSIADPQHQWKLAASVLDKTGVVRARVSYLSAGPWDTKGECEAFAYGSGDGASKLDESIDRLTEAATKVLGASVVAGVGVSCVPSSER